MTTTKPTRLEVNCTTGEQKVVELTAAEIAELDQINAKAEEQRLAKEAEDALKEEIKTSAVAKLAALGLTEDEAKAILK